MSGTIGYYEVQVVRLYLQSGNMVLYTFRSKREITVADISKWFCKDTSYDRQTQRWKIIDVENDIEDVNLDES